MTEKKRLRNDNTQEPRSSDSEIYGVAVLSVLLSSGDEPMKRSDCSSIGRPFWWPRMLVWAGVRWDE